MTKVETFAGFDVSKTYFDVCLLHQGQPSTRRFSYDEQGLRQTTEWLPAHCCCTMEATGPYHLKLALHLHQAGFVVSVVNPLVIRRFCQMRLKRAKTDRSDARMIAAYAQSEHPTRWQPPQEHLMELQQWQALSDQLEKQHTALVNQREAFRSSTLMAKEVQALLDKTIEGLQQKIQEVQTKMQTLARQHYAAMLDHLTTIPGVGLKTAMVLICITAGFSRFENSKQLSAYVGLSPRIYDSGTTIKGRARICKMGMSRIRALLYLCAWSAKRYNKACQALFERLVAKGKSKQLALIAVANKLLKQAFAIATHNTAYQNNYAKNICL